MRLIDADALKEYIGSVRAEFNFFDDDERARYEAHSKAIYLLDLYVNDAPSIDIVRCENCRKSHIDGKTTHYLWCVEWGRSTDVFGYCERGEREGE